MKRREGDREREGCTSFGELTHPRWVVVVTTWAKVQYKTKRRQEKTQENTTIHDWITSIYSKCLTLYKRWGGPLIYAWVKDLREIQIKIQEARAT